MKVSVCIPTVRPSTIRHAVAAVIQQSWQDWELVVVGQGPEESDLRAQVRAGASGDARVRYTHLDRMNASLARNAGIASTSCEVIAFTDDDCEPAEDWLAVIVDRFTSDHELGLVGGAVLRPDDGPIGWLTTCPTNEPGEVRYDPVAAGRSRPTGWDWIGANFAIRRGAAERVGPFDESIGPGTPFPSGEDTDWKFRLEDLGIIMLTTPESIVQHTYGARSGIRAGMKHSRNYSRGNAAMAAKRTLNGDQFGEEWRSLTMRGTSAERRRDIQPHRIPIALLRRWYFERAYRQVLAEYVTGSTGVLAQRTPPSPDAKPGTAAPA